MVSKVVVLVPVCLRNTYDAGMHMLYVTHCEHPLGLRGERARRPEVGWSAGRVQCGSGRTKCRYHLQQGVAGEHLLRVVCTCALIMHVRKKDSRQTLDLRRGYVTSFPPNQVNDSNKGSNGPAGSRSGKLHSEERA